MINYIQKGGEEMLIYLISVGVAILAIISYVFISWANTYDDTKDADP
jgi:uncharacterized protein YggT (Ycf19 family)